MNKSIIIVIFICILLLFSSCGYSDTSLKDMRDFSTSTEQIIAQQYMDSIITAVNTQDIELLQNLFSKNIVKNHITLEQEVHALFDFYEGEITEYSGSVGQISAGRNNGVLTKYAHASYDLLTENESYRIAFKFCLKDSEVPNNIGLLSIYTISQSDSNMQFTYWGGDEWLEGIVIQSNS